MAGMNNYINGMNFALVCIGSGNGLLPLGNTPLP